MKFVFFLMFFTLGFSAQATTIDCYDNDGRWTHMRITNAGSRSAIFEILDANEAGQREVGGIANLKLVKKVHPRGETFFHYQGTFEDDFRQKTISMYVKEDLTVLTRIYNGRPYDVACY